MFLLREFRWPMGVFLGLILGGGLLVHVAYDREQVGYVEACYDVYLLIFMEPQLRFPEAWPLRILFFLVPIVGLGAVADSVVRLGYFIFARKQQLQEWHVMHASAMAGHYVVVGCGKVGYRLIRQLHEMGEEVVAIEQHMDTPLVAEILDLDVPVLKGDGRQKKILEQANVKRAKAVLLVTNDDLANLDAALTAREIRDDVRVVLRLFDDTLATKVAGSFKMPAISTSQAAAPAFIAAATGRTVYHSFRLDGQDMHLVDVPVEAGGPWAGRSVGDLQRDRNVNVVMHVRGDRRDVNPGPATLLAAGDHLVVLCSNSAMGVLKEGKTT